MKRMSAQELGRRVAAQVTRLNEDSTYTERSNAGADYLSSYVESLATWAARYANDDATALHAVAKAIQNIVEAGPLALASGTSDNPTPVAARASRYDS